MFRRVEITTKYTDLQTLQFSQKYSNAKGENLLKTGYLLTDFC
jgi:hypothetical protein